jgi:hypothetical protein
MDAVSRRLGRFYGKRGDAVVAANLAVIADAWDKLVEVLPPAAVAAAAPGSDPRLPWGLPPRRPYPSLER